MTLVSVVVFSDNSANTLEGAIGSALIQTLPPDKYEVLLVDDGSSDHTGEIAGIYQKRFNHLRYLRIPVHKGHSAAYDCALEAARGEYFIQVMPDDALHREALHWFTGILEASKTDFVYSDRYEVSMSDSSYSHVSMEPFDLSRIADGGAIVRSKILREIGGYRPLALNQLDLYMRYLKRSKHSPVHLPKPLYYRTQVSGEASPHEWEEFADYWDSQTLEEVGLSRLAPSPSTKHNEGLTVS